MAATRSAARPARAATCRDLCERQRATTTLSLTQIPGNGAPLRSRRGRRRPRVRKRNEPSRRDPDAPGRLGSIGRTRRTGDRVLPRIHGVAVELPVVVRLDRLGPDVDRGAPDVPPRSGRTRRPSVAERGGPTGEPCRRTRRGDPSTRRGVARRSLPRRPGRLARRRTGRSRRCRRHRSGRRRGRHPTTLAAAASPATFTARTLVVGAGLGGRCAPASVNHEHFAAAAPPGSTHVVIDSMGHGDVLDDRPARGARRLCGGSADARHERHIVAQLIGRFVSAKPDA
jgi:hypothetical protein